MQHLYNHYQNCATTQQQSITSPSVPIDPETSTKEESDFYVKEIHKKATIHGFRFDDYFRSYGTMKTVVDVSVSENFISKEKAHALWL